MSHEIDSSCTDDITCPYCGYELQDSWECDADGEIDCEECDNSFSYYSERDVRYWSERNCELNGKEHEWEVKREYQDATMEKCANCDVFRFLPKEPDTTGDLFPASADAQEATK